jgi:hypothetical protein
MTEACMYEGCVSTVGRRVNINCISCLSNVLIYQLMDNFHVAGLLQHLLPNDTTRTHKGILDI